MVNTFTTFEGIVHSCIQHSASRLILPWHKERHSNYPSLYFIGLIIVRVLWKPCKAPFLRHICNVISAMRIALSLSSIYKGFRLHYSLMRLLCVKIFYIHRLQSRIERTSRISLLLMGNIRLFKFCSNIYQQVRGTVNIQILQHMCNITIPHLLRWN